MIAMERPIICMGSHGGEGKPPTTTKREQRGMNIHEAKAYKNRRVGLTWLDRKGQPVSQVVDVYDVNFVPFYGPCMITDAGEIRLDRIQSCEPAERIAA
jgi:hypothetical protein